MWISHWLPLVVSFISYITGKTARWVYVAFHICSELRCRGAHPSSSGCTGSPGMRVSVYLPLSPWLHYVSLRLSYNIHHISSDVTYVFFCCFISERVLAWYINKSEGDYSRRNMNKNSLLPLLQYLCESLHPSKPPKRLWELQQMPPLPFWSLTSLCCSSRGPAGCSQRSWFLCELQAPGALLCTAPSCSPRAVFPETSFWSGLVALLVRSNVLLPKMATWQWQCPFKGSYGTGWE